MNTKRLSIMFFLATTAALCSSGVWGAWGGTEDGDAHPMVGAMYADFSGDGQIQWFELICSGSYAGSSTDGAYDVFLTAGHCVAPFVALFGVTDFWVAFDPDPAANADGVPAGLIKAEASDWDPRFFDVPGNLVYDSAVLLLPPGSVQVAYPGLEPVVLPPAGYLDDLKRSGELNRMVMEIVGYGVVPVWQQPGGTAFGFDGVRRTSLSVVKGLTRVFLNFNQNENATDLGGLCFGDSGSPQFVPGTTMIVSTTSGGDPNCRANNFNYRLDTERARSFLGQYLNLP